MKSVLFWYLSNRVFYSFQFSLCKIFLSGDIFEYFLMLFSVSEFADVSKIYLLYIVKCLYIYKTCIKSLHHLTAKRWGEG